MIYKKIIIIITLLQGAYEIYQITSEISRQMKLNRHWDNVTDKNYIEIIPRSEINRIVIYITNINY